MGGENSASLRGKGQAGLGVFVQMTTPPPGQMGGLLLRSTAAAAGWRDGRSEDKDDGEGELFRTLLLCFASVPVARRGR